MRDYYSNLDRIFENFFNDNNVGWKTYKVVSTNQTDRNDEYEINNVKDGAYFHFEVPGFNKENLDVTIEGSELVIEGTRPINYRSNRCGRVTYSLYSKFQKRKHQEKK